MSSLLQQATRILRGSKNSHRFICFINGKIRTFCTHIDDIDSQVAALFGALNGVNAVPQFSAAGVLLVMALTLAQPAAYALDPLALPTGYQSISGNHQFDQHDGILNVSTNASKSIVNYDSFNIGSQAKVNFNLPSSNSSILNRVVGGGMSEIYGTMTSNGKVFLVNPAGIFFGNGANVSVNGLVASTLGIADHKFLSGLFDFSRTPGSAPGQIKIDPNATINILNGGSASFLASSFSNAGTINAPGGAIQIGVGDRITLGDDLIGINVTEPLKETLEHAAIMNSGLLSAAQVKFIASTLKQSVMDTIVNNTGRISANKVIDGEGGVVELIADNGLVNNSGVIDASGTTGGQITLNGEASQNSGQLLAMGNQGIGGDVHVLGDSVSLIDHAVVDVSGQTGGGSALIGGDYKGGNAFIRNALYTYVDKDVQINARALDAGNGGKVIIWGSEATGYYGTILAQGGLHGGNGGFVETSGKNLLLMDGSVDASALHPDGHGGTWLLDPRNVSITNDTNNVSFFDFLNTRTYTPTSLLLQLSEIKASAINAALNGGTDVTVNTGNYGLQDGDIRVQANILKTSGNSATLQLLAANDIFIDSTGSIKSTANSPLNVVLKADNDVFGGIFGPSNGNGDVTLNGDISLKSGDVTLSGQSVTLNKLLKTSGDVTITALNGNITQNSLTSAISGSDLIADANGTNHTIDLRNADFDTAKLTTDSGKIDYTDTDGATVTVQVNNSNAVANVITEGTGSANNDTNETHLIIANANKAKELNYTAKSGDIKMLSNSDSATADKVTMTTENGSILQQGGSIKGDTSVNLKASGATGTINQTGGTMQGESLSAQATGSAQAVNISNADFTSASLTSNNGKIDYSDRDGATVTVNAGTGDAAVTTNAVGVTATNSNAESNLTILGTNIARDLSFTAKQGNVLLNGGSSAAASRNASLTASAGGVTQGGGTLSATGSLTVSASGAIQQTGGSMTALNTSLTSSNGGITQSGGSIGATTTLSLSASGNIQQSGGSMSALATSLSSSGGTITQSNGTLSGTNALSLSASGNIQQTGGAMNGASVSLSSTGGTISQSGGTINGTSLTAQTNASGKAISITNADFGSAGLVTNNGKIDYSDMDGATVTVNAGTNDANVTTFATGTTATNGALESNLTISGTNVAKDMTFTAKQGNILLNGPSSAAASHNANLTANAGGITQSGGILSATNALTLNASGNIAQSGGSMTGQSVSLTSTGGGITQSVGTMQGTSLTAQTNGAGQAISVGNADFGSASLTTNNGKIDYSDRDGASVTVKAGTNTANVTTFASGTSATNNTAEADLVITGANVANDLNFTAKQGNITIAASQSATASHDANLTATLGGITQTGGTLSATNALNLNASGTIQQSGGGMNGQSVSLTSTGGAISQTGGTMHGTSLTAQANGAGQAISITNADFGSASLTSNNSKIDYSDTDGVTVTVNAGTNDANVTTFASPVGTSANNGVVESNLTISGTNVAKDMTFTAKQGNILLNGPSSAAASHNANLTANAGGITQSGGSLSATNALTLNASGTIQQSGGSMTGQSVSLTSTGGAITQSVGTMLGSSLTAQTNGAGQAISVGNADFGSASLTTNNGKIDYSDRDGASVTVNAGTNNANVTTFAAGTSATNGVSEADLVITGANVANDLNLTAKNGNITQAAGSVTASHEAALTTNNGSILQSGGSITGPSVKLTATGGAITQSGGTMQGASLTAQTNTSGQAIAVNNADFGSASLTTNNGKIDYKDTDGASITVKAGTNTATITTFAAGTSANNGVVETNFIISGTNQGKDLTFTANQGDMLLNSGSSAAASQNATLTANNGSIKQSGGSLSAGSTLKLATTNGDIQQTGGSMSGQTVKLTANNGSIAQTGGDLSGRDLQASTTTAGKSIEIDHADFKTAQLTTNNGGIQYTDTDGVAVNANAGLSSASNVSIEAETGGNLNGNGEFGITLTGDNVAHTLSLKTNANNKTFFTLTAGDINQANGSTITAHDLTVKTNVGNVSLDNSNANDVNTLTATSKSGSVSYQDKNGVTLSSVNLNSDGNGSRGDLSIQANGSGNIDQTGAIVGVDKLSVETDNGNVTLSHDSNDANDLSASSHKGNVIYHDANNINVAGVNLDNDFSGSQGNLTIQTNGSGNITQSGAIFNVDTLSVTTDTGNATLVHPLNDVRHLIAKSNEGDVSYRDIDDVNVKSANLDMDGNEVRGNLSLQTAFSGNISQTGLIEGVDTLKLRTDLGNANLQLDNNVNNLNAGTNYGTFQFTNAKSFTLTGANMNMNNLLWKGDLNLTAKTGTITQTAAINASELKVNGNAELTNANNTVDVFSAFGHDSTVSFTDKNGFNLGRTDIGSNGTLNLETVSGHINQDYYFPELSTILRNRNITANGGITAGTLNLTLGTNATARLTDTGNAIRQFSLQGDSSHTQLVDSTDLTVTSANDGNGILETTILGGHNLDQTGTIGVKGLKVTMADGGDFTLDNADNDVQALSANATGENTASTQGSFVDGHGGFALASSQMGNGDLSLEARHGGNIVQAGLGDALPEGNLQADELKITMTGGGDADLSTQANRVNVLSANAKNEASAPVVLPPFILLKTVNLVEGPPHNDAPPELPPAPPAETPAVDTTGNTQILFRNDQNLNIAESNLGHGDLGVTLTSGGNLDQAHLPTSRNITTTGGIHGNELSVSMIDGGSANLTTQINTVSVFSGNASGESHESGASIIRLNNVGDLNLAHSDVGQGELHITNTGNIDNRNLSGTDRDITANDSTLTGNMIALDAQGSGSLDIHNDINGGSAVQLTTSNSYGNIYIHSGATVSSPNGKVTLNSDKLTLDGYVQGQTVQIWPWNLSLAMGIAGGPGGLILSQGLIDHINKTSSLGLNTLMFGHKDYKGTIILGSLDLSHHTLTDAAFNAPRVFDATPNNDSKSNLIMAANRNAYFTAGADDVAHWASAPGGVSFGDNSSRFADLDVNVSGSGLIYVHLKDFTGSGNSYAILSADGNKAFINADDEDNSGSLKNLGSALASRASSLIINQLKGSTIVLPGNPVNNQPTPFGNVRPVQFIPNQSL